MNKFLGLPLIASVALMLGACSFGTGPQGDLVGAQDRPEFNPQEVPFGMVPCPGGTFHMGQTDEDIAASMVNMNKQVTIAGFYMDETEITNNEYRQFMNAVMQDMFSLGSITVPVLYMPSATDLYFPVGDARYESQYILHVTLKPIPSLWGHPAGAGAGPGDLDFLNENIAAFLRGKPLEGEPIQHKAP